MKKKKEKTQSNKIRNENREVAMDTAEIQSIIRDYCKQLYASKMGNLELRVLGRGYQRDTRKLLRVMDICLLS